jgi:hypothetical protein
MAQVIAPDEFTEGATWRRKQHDDRLAVFGAFAQQRLPGCRTCERAGVCVSRPAGCAGSFGTRCL